MLEGSKTGSMPEVAEALKGSQTSHFVGGDGLAVAVFALPVFCGDLRGVVACAVDAGVHPYPVVLDGCQWWVR